MPVKVEFPEPLMVNLTESPVANVRLSELEYAISPLFSSPVTPSCKILLESVSETIF